MTRLRSSLVLAFVAALAVSIASAGSPRAAPAPLSGPSVIAFAGSQSGPAQLWLMNVDSGQLQRLTAGRYDQDAPAWSPDGTRLVYSTTRRVRVPGLASPQITPLMAIMTLRTRAVRTLTSGRDFDETPAWSPNGRRIAFSRTLMNPASTITTYSSVWTMDPAGHGLRRLTQRPVNDMAPAWSPSGRLIAFGRSRSPNSYRVDLWLMRGDGSRERLLARNASHPAWSPDGTRIAFALPKPATGNACCARDLYVMNADGSRRHLLVRDAGQPTWSPDGSRIVYTAIAKHPQLWVIGADGANRRRLTAFANSASAAAWRPQ